MKKMRQDIQSISIRQQDPTNLRLIQGALF